MSLDSLLKTKVPTDLADDRGGWRQYVLDHLKYIADRSYTFEIDGEAMQLYQYDLRRFLLERLKRNTDIAWIVQLINNMPNDLVFDSPMTLLVPSDQFMRSLHLIYTTVSQS